MDKNLQVLYEEVLEQYYKTDKYIIPTISWSNEYMLSRYGEYQLWKNHIIISKALNTDQVSDMAVKSVIYHELLHQELVEHNKELYKKERIFPNLSIYKSELKKFFDSILEDQLLDPPNRFGEGKTIIFYELPNEDYLNDIVYYYKKLYVFQDKETTFSDEILNVNNPFVIWIVLKEGIYYIVGWSDNCNFYSKKQEIKHSIYGGLDICYQITSKSENCYMLLPVNCVCAILEEYFPLKLKKMGYVLENDIKEFFSK